MRLVIGNKAYSTWSLRPWLVLKRAGADFEEVMIRLNEPDTAEQIARHSPTGKVPVLEVDGQTVWDSLAIAVWANERYPEARLWPADEHARWLARSMCCEMHSGFPNLRDECSMGPATPMVGPADEVRQISDATQAEIRRLIEMWREARARYATRGPYLCGEWSVADAFFTPVAARIRRFGIDLAALGDDGVARTYVDTLLEQPDFLEWERAGLAES